MQASDEELSKIDLEMFLKVIGLADFL